MKFLWTTLRVSDLDRSLSFYQDALGMELSGRFGAMNNQIAMLGTPEGAKLELLCAGGEAMPEAPGQGVSMGFAPADLDGLVAALKEKGIAVAGPISPNPTIRFFFVRDPDGYVVQLAEEH